MDGELAQKLIAIDAVTDIAEALRSHCNPALVSVLSVVDGLAKYESGRAAMKAGPTVGTLLNLVKQFDDFVAPAATRVLCSLLQEDDLRETMLQQFGVLSTFLDMLDRCSDETKQVACHALVNFAQHDDVQRMLSEDGYLQKLAKRVQSHVPNKRDGAIIALVALGSTPVRAAVTEAIRAAETIQVLVARLNKKSTALAAALALAHLMGIVR
ncbi:ARM repeat-containing protein [Imleria badia]|nr:ARM repeat-containing protein [Imleria badia]